LPFFFLGHFSSSAVLIGITGSCISGGRILIIGLLGPASSVSSYIIISSLCFVLAFFFSFALYYLSTSRAFLGGSLEDVC